MEWGKGCLLRFKLLTATVTGLGIKDSPRSCARDILGSEFNIQETYIS